MTAIATTAQEITVQRTFIDSNVWLYAFIKGQDLQKEQRANQVISTTPNIQVSTQVISEVCANIIKHKLLDEDGIRALIDTFYVRHSVIDVAYTVLREATTIREEYSLSYWDSTIVAAALESGAAHLLSEDMHDGLVVRGQITIVNPFK